MITLDSPFPIKSLPRVWSWIELYRDRIADDFFAKDIDAFVDQWIEKEATGRRSWAVRRGGIIGGVITSERVRPTVADFHCVFAVDFWGRDTVVPALGQVCDIIFQDPAIDKLSTIAFAKNHSLAGMMRHFGVTREGLLYGHTRQGGKLVDLQLLGLQRSRFYVVWNQRTAREFELDVEHGRTDQEFLQSVDVDKERFQQRSVELAERDEHGRQRGDAQADPEPVPGADAAGFIQTAPIPVR